MIRGVHMPATRCRVEIRPILPERLKRLEELANDLCYSWECGVRRLFRHLDQCTWALCRGNPKVFLRRVSQARLEEAVRNPIFLADYGGILSVYDTYLRERPLTESPSPFDPTHELIAYFSAGFGFHQSMPIYVLGTRSTTSTACSTTRFGWIRTTACSATVSNAA
jgi:starch phosphorylase